MNKQKNKEYHIRPFREIFSRLKFNSREVCPRGMKCLEIENFYYVLPPYVRFCSFEKRKLNLNYIKREFLWYLKGDRFDGSIGEYASLWNDIKNSDGSINSNYGQYFFGEQGQFNRAIDLLLKDKDTRQACIIILNNDHLNMNTRDVPCTYGVNFRIRDDRLNMTVRMRSQDAIYGMGNDAPCFSFIHEMAYVILKEKYKELDYGTYYHSCDSFHIYEKHYEMLDNLLIDYIYDFVDCPKISCRGEVDMLMKLHTLEDKELVPCEYEFIQWLLQNS